MENNKTFPFTITVEDWNNSGKSWLNINNCPATIALKRQFPEGEPMTTTGKRVVQIEEPNGLEIVLGTLADAWDYLNFVALKEGIEFRTTITFI